MHTETVREIVSDQIDLPERQMRRDIDRDALHDLADNIRKNGLINPITVRPVGERFELVAGQRRLLAMRIAGIISIPCVVKDLDDAHAISVMAAENLERKDVDPVDEADFIKLVMDTERITVGQMAERLQRSEAYVKDRLAISGMPDYMREFIKTGELKLGVALKLMAIEPDDKRRVWVGMAIEQNISVRQADWWAEQHRLGTLPSGEVSAADIPGAPPGAPREILFECELDGSQHPPSDMVTVMIWKGNFPAFRELGIALKEAVVVDALPPGGGEDPAPVGAGPSRLGVGEGMPR